MEINSQMIEAMIIYSYKHERFELCQELLKILPLFQDKENYTVTKDPYLKLVSDLDVAKKRDSK